VAYSAAACAVVRREWESTQDIPAVALPRVLLIEDERALLKAYARELGDIAEVYAAASSAEALSLVAEYPDLILTDSIGLPAVRELRARGCRAPVVVISGSAYHPHALLGLEPIETRMKPVDLDELRGLVARLAKREA
jgi:DNA-binding response OmpR family regulator